MFWKRKQIPITPLGTKTLFSFTDTPARKEFVNMYDLLREAERLDNIEEFKLSDDILNVLGKYIGDYKNGNHNG